jgi:hypothetical protein
MDPVAAVWDHLRVVLDEMGELAVAGEKPWGLRCYPHLHRELYPDTFRRSAWEERITDGVLRGLKQRGISANTETRYPRTYERCDLVISIRGTRDLWIEVKTAYREDLNGVLDGTRPIELPYGSSWEAGVDDIRAKDIRKLNSLRPVDASYVGIVLLGFDREGKPLTDEELYGRLRDELDNWTAAHGARGGITRPDRYPGRAKIGYRDRLWFWYRPVT